MTTSALVAVAVAILAFVFIEGLRNMYPSPTAWARLRRARGREAVRRMRERFEEASERRTPKLLATLLLILVVAWVAASSLLDKRWYEVAFDSIPYAIVGLALLRTPGALHDIAERMKNYERKAGEDPDSELDGDDGGPTALAL